MQKLLYPFNQDLFDSQFRETITETLMEYLHDANKNILLPTIEALGKLTVSQSIPYLQEILVQDTKELRIKVAKALGHFPNKDVLRILHRALDGEDNDEVRIVLISVLGKKRHSKVLSLFIEN